MFTYHFTQFEYFLVNLMCFRLQYRIYKQVEFSPGVQNFSKSEYTYGLYNMICLSKVSEYILWRRLHSGKNACKHFARTYVAPMNPSHGLIPRCYLRQAIWMQLCNATWPHANCSGPCLSYVHTCTSMLKLQSIIEGWTHCWSLPLDTTLKNWSDINFVKLS